MKVVSFIGQIKSLSTEDLASIKDRATADGRDKYIKANKNGVAPMVITPLGGEAPYKTIVLDSEVHSHLTTTADKGGRVFCEGVPDGSGNYNYVSQVLSLRDYMETKELFPGLTILESVGFEAKAPIEKPD